MSLGATLGIGGIYADPITPAVQRADELVAYQFPPVTEKHFAAVRKFRMSHPHTCLLVEVMTFQQALMGYILGIPDFMMALHDHPNQIKTFMRRMADWVVEIIRHAVRDGADIVYLQDDYGTTGRPLISMKMWEEFTYPHLKRLIDTAHEEGVPMMLHSCGYQMPFLESYAKAGLDILQSFQPKAGNNFQEAYDIYGDRLICPSLPLLPLARFAFCRKLTCYKKETPCDCATRFFTVTFSFLLSLQTAAAPLPKKSSSAIHRS